MTKKPDKSKSKSKPRKLKLNKETIKDLEPQEDSKVKGGRAPVTGKPTCYIRHCP